MKKNRAVSICFALAVILLVLVTAAVPGRGNGKKQELELIKQEVSEQIERNMEKAVKEGNFSEYLEPSEVSFVVKDVYKENVLRYAVHVTFMAKTNRKLNETEMKEAARDMENLFQEFQTAWGKHITVCPQMGKGGVVSVINGKVVDREAGTSKGTERNGRKLVVKRKGYERTFFIKTSATW